MNVRESALRCILITDLDGSKYQESFQGGTMVCSKVVLSLLLVLLPATVFILAQNISGRWQGKVQTPHHMRVVLMVSMDKAGGLKTYLDPVDQGPEHNPITSISMTHGELD